MSDIVLYIYIKTVKMGDKTAEFYRPRHYFKYKNVLPLRFLKRTIYMRNFCPAGTAAARKILRRPLSNSPVREELRNIRK